jgi:hypothetical protein
MRAAGPVHPAEACDRYLHPARWAPQITGVVTDARSSHRE